MIGSHAQLAYQTWKIMSCAEGRFGEVCWIYHTILSFFWSVARFEPLLILTPVDVLVPSNFS